MIFPPNHAHGETAGLLLRLLALASGPVLLLALWGLGRLVGRAVCVARGAGWAVTVLLGLAGVAGLGGWLGLAQLFDRRACLLLIGIGMVAAIREWRASPPWAADGPFRAFLAELRASPMAAAGWGVFAICAAFLFAGSFWTTRFEPHDDLGGYFAFVEKLLQTGSLGREPFSERRIVSGLGGNYPLLALAAAPSAREAMLLIEAGLMPVVVAGLTWRLARSQGCGPGAAAWIAAGTAVFCATGFERINTTASLVGAAFLFPLFVTATRRTGDGPEDDAALGPLAFGLLAGTTLALKNNLVLPVAVTGLVWAAWTFRREGVQIGLRQVLGASGVSLLALLPWMVASQLSHATPWFPLLGRGYHVTAYEGGAGSIAAGLHAESLWPSLSTFVALRPAQLLAAVLPLGLLLHRARFLWRGEPWLVLGLLAAGLANAIAAHGCHARRYSAPFVYPALVVLLLRVAARPCGTPGPAWLFRWAGILAFAAAARVMGASLYHAPAWTLRDVTDGCADAWLGRRLDSAARAERDVRLLSQVPPTAEVLARLDRSYLLPFRSHRIWIADWPGSASPPPGMPLNGDPEQLAAYLLGQGVGFIAYAYSNRANYGANMAHQTNAAAPLLLQLESLRAYAVQGAIEGLGETRLRLFDDGSVYVLDIARTNGSPAGAASGPAAGVTSP